MNLKAIDNYFNSIDIPVILIVKVRSIKTFQGLFELQNVNLPIVYDPDGHLINRNKLQGEQCILLDSKNRILVTGNPIENNTTQKAYETALSR